MNAHAPATRLIAALAVLFPLTFAVASATLPTAHAIPPINAVIGDQSFIQMFGRAPSTADDERTRIAAGTNRRTDALAFGIDLRVPLEEVSYEEVE